ncbi:hypothetical protein GCM10025867_51240 (plasmid) [Frondihabitans sucicola]|uniref:Uncharacterized protein n=1 Tax=Frondihabitans sucicola TaxID=1268041 RepID=A0ABM8GV29_9MICO|nr:hypothetical protein [Frondihabitans sucicola]BDZ52315.1 hypothetical protein GCM10025867_45560 [Frondihabitans sucicola]BDZ52883.1 hypothetical protein GCM10025867_51240 [Frondihabitans sucicola]
MTKNKSTIKQALATIYTDPLPISLNAIEIIFLTCGTFSAAVAAFALAASEITGNAFTVGTSSAGASAVTTATLMFVAGAAYAITVIRVLRKGISARKTLLARED